MRRALFAAAFVAATMPAVAAGKNDAGKNEPVALALDEVHTIAFRAPVATVYVGNPSIADVTMVDARHAFVQGKGYGRTNIVADLRTGALDLDRIEPAGQRQPAAPSQPIDTTPLPNVDGTFRFLASSLSAGQLRLANLEVAATLKDGILTLSALKGALYGGTLSLSGAVNAMGPALSFNIGGDAQGMHLRHDDGGDGVLKRLIGQQVDEGRAGDLREPQFGENELHGFFAKGAQLAERADRIGMRVRFGEAGQPGGLGPLGTEEFEIQGNHE